MPEIYLAVDFGSTYTKLTAIDLQNEEILYTTSSKTTIETNIMNGFNLAFNELKEKLNEKFGESNYCIKYKNACSSAAGGLKIIAIGLVPELTTLAAKTASLSAGGRVIKTYAFLLNDENIEEIKQTNYDIIILSGGTNGGNQEYILNNAKKLALNNIDKPIIVAGNEETYSEIEKIFKNMDHYFTENVMPVVNKINAEPLRKVIREVFMKNITKAKGMENVKESLKNVIMPTPTAVIKAAELLSKGINDKEGLGDIMIVDIGGATTDVHSIANGFPKSNNIQLKGMEEPFLKRTVEGDLGMRYSSMALYETTTLNKIRMYLGTKDSKINIRENFKYRQECPDFISSTEEDILFDEMMAMICTEIATSRHSGMLECIYSPMGTLFTQSGKDLTDVKYIIGTGGVIINSNNPEKILSLAIYKEEDSLILKPKYAKFLLDKKYILSAMGLLAEDFPEIAFNLLKKYIIEI